MAELFLYLLAAHLIGDWLIQTKGMAEGKSRNWQPLLAHVFTYHIVVFAALYLAGIPLISNLLATLFLAATHAVLDNRRFEFWWLKVIKGVEEKDVPIWLLVGVDQSFHLLLLFLVSLVLGG